MFVTDVVSVTKKPGLGEYKEIYISLITLGGLLATAIIGSVTKIILAKIRSSDQNNVKSENDSSTPSEEDRRSSDLSNPEKPRKERKYRTRERKKSLCTHELDFPQERPIDCSDKRSKGRRSPDDTVSKRCYDENKKMIPTQLAVSGVTKYTVANSSISDEDQLSNGESMVVTNQETRMDGSAEEKPPARNRQLQPQIDTKVETQETESNLAWQMTKKCDQHQQSI